MLQQNENVFHVCSTAANSNGSLQYMGYWSTNAGLSLKNTKLFENDFVDFGDKRLLVTALPVVYY